MHIACVALSALASLVCHAEHYESDDAVDAVVQQVADSRRLYQRGLARQDSAILAIAAELRAEALGTWQPSGDLPGGVPTPQDMLGLARQLAKSNSALATVVEQIGSRRLRGNTNGPLVRHVTIDAQHPLNIETSFAPRFPAVIYLEGVSDVRFSVHVRDPDGTTVCDDQTDKAYKLCRFLPDQTEPYSLEATSAASKPVELLLITN